MNPTVDPVLLVAYLWFAWVGAVTPGPNTMVALACGIQGGLRSIVPHLFGVVIGVSVMMMVALSGAQALIDVFPVVGGLLRWVGAVWLVWMGLQLARTDAVRHGTAVRPPTVWESALLQWANPKAWMVISGTAAAWRGVASPAWLDMLVVTALFAGSCALALLLWGAGGARLSGWLERGERLRAVNRALGVSLMLTACWLVWP